MLDTVTRVLEDARQPMSVSEIHFAANEVLGRSIRRTSIKAILAAYTVGGDCRFDRPRRGVYQLR